MKSLTALTLAATLATPVQASEGMKGNRCFEGAMLGGMTAVTATIVIAGKNSLPAIPVALLGGMLVGCHLAS